MPEVEGQIEAARRLRQFARQFPGRLSRSGLRRGAKVIKAQTVDRIKRTKTDEDGRKWEPWSTDYAATRGPRHSLLVDSKAMMLGLRVEQDGPDMLMGSPLPRARSHQEGSGKMPARPPFGVTERDEPPIQEALDRWVEEELATLGLS